MTFFSGRILLLITKNWVIDLCKLIIDSKYKIQWVCNSRVDTIDAERLKYMKKAGCWGISFGIESANEDILIKMKKHIKPEQAISAVKLCREFGIKSLLYFVIGMPWDTKDTILESIKFAKELKGDFTEFHIAIPFPGTELHKIVKQNSLFTLEDLTGYDYSYSPIRTFTLSKEELLKLRKKAFIELYLNPLFIIKTLWNTHSPKVAANYIKFGFSKLKELLAPEKTDGDL